MIDFTNRSHASCVLDGYPGVNLAGGTPLAPIGLPAAVANALLQISAVSVGTGG